VVRAADGFVAGEASAVVNWIERSRPVPIGKHPRMSARGVAGRPTLVQNVETLAHVALVARHGAQWFRAVGTDDEPGTMLVTLAGAVQHQGVVETEIGVPVSDLLERAGGPIAPLQALLVGGYFGRWVRYEDVATRAYSSRGMGTSVGAGYVGAFPVGACGVSQSAALVGYLAGESAGQCGPCVFGLPAVAGSLSTLAHGDPVDRGLLLKWLDEIPGRGACSHPDGVVAHVASAFEVFGADVERHLSGRCLEGSSRLVLPVPRGQV
jgi:NADH:ubiquinone oxidoreductase subunit F (NADH-binding)